MSVLATGQAAAFWLLAPVMVLAAIVMIMTRKPVHSALCLATVMLCLAVQYAALDAPFLFAVQIIVYTGAILMLFVFVVMLVGVDSRDSLVEVLQGQRVLAGLAGAAVLALLVGAVGSAFTTDPVGLNQVDSAGGTNVTALAGLIFGRYVMIFQAAGALLLTATVAALILAHRERLRTPPDQAARMRGRMQRYAETGEHPGPLPTPGYYARRTAVDVPALLPDGSPAPNSVSQTLRARGQVLDPRQVAAPTARVIAALDDPQSRGTDLAVGNDHTDGLSGALPPAPAPTATSAGGAPEPADPDADTDPGTGTGPATDKTPERPGGGA